MSLLDCLYKYRKKSVEFLTLDRLTERSRLYDKWMMNEIQNKDTVSLKFFTICREFPDIGLIQQMLEKEFKIYIVISEENIKNSPDKEGIMSILKEYPQQLFLYTVPYELEDRATRLGRNILYEDNDGKKEKVNWMCVRENAGKRDIMYFDEAIREYVPVKDLV